MEQPREAEEDQTETMQDEGWAPPDERTATAAGWWPRWLSWRPTSTGLLAETEREMLRRKLYLFISLLCAYSFPM